KRYGLESFDITVQSLELTLVDKLYALNTYYLKGRIDARSRHLYDIHKILPHVVFDKEFFDLLAEIGEKERNDFEKMREPVDFDPSGLAGSLREIVDEETYRKDYENNTMPLLFDRTPYEDVIASLLSVIDEIDVEEGEFLIDEVIPMDVRRTSASVTCP
ncbi:MAG: nucleotidyl transferase AbiEii/AbiGii toxin family protein, partial [Methanomassiliicoccaceae archaeon]|nr:nucleotidyl transferase AbiEii/AbiGii toxin family protein [Methanomassiliicoccaceae archaeon]